MPAAAANDREHLAPALEYARLQRLIHELIAQGKADTEEHEALADLGDAPWYAMTERERERMRGLSMDLYALGEGGPKRVRMSAEELAQWEEAARAAQAKLDCGDVDAALAFLRQPIPEGLPAYVVPFVQAQCWDKLGDPDTSAVFMKAARELDSGHALAVLPLSLRLERLETVQLKKGA